MVASMEYRVFRWLTMTDGGRQQQGAVGLADDVVLSRRATGTRYSKCVVKSAR